MEYKEKKTEVSHASESDEHSTTNKVPTLVTTSFLDYFHFPSFSYSRT